MPSIGTISALDEVVQKFLQESLAAEHLEAAKLLVEQEYQNDRKAGMYIKIMEKIKERGVGYLKDETQRVQLILKGKISEEKRVEMGDKLKILNGIIARQS